MSGKTISIAGCDYRLTPVNVDFNTQKQAGKLIYTLKETVKKKNHKEFQNILKELWTIFKSTLSSKEKLAKKINSNRTTLYEIENKNQFAGRKEKNIEKLKNKIIIELEKEQPNL